MRGMTITCIGSVATFLLLLRFGSNSNVVIARAPPPVQEMKDVPLICQDVPEARSQQATCVRYQVFCIDSDSINQVQCERMAENYKKKYGEDFPQLQGTCLNYCFPWKEAPPDLDDLPDLCMVDLPVLSQASPPDCDCATTSFPVVEDEKCCAPYGISIPKDNCCPIGQDVCCGLSLEECMDEVVNPFAGELTRKVFGDDSTSTQVAPVPIFFVLDAEKARNQVTNVVYEAATSYGRRFEFTMTQILLEAGIFQDYVQPDLGIPQEQLDEYIASLTTPEDKALLEELLLEDWLSPKDLQNLGETVSQSYVFEGTFLGYEEDVFVGLMTTHFDTSDTLVASFILEGQTREDDDERNQERRSLIDIADISPELCHETVQAAEDAASLACKDGKEFKVEEPCKAALILACEVAIENARGEYDTAIAIAKGIKEAVLVGLVAYRLYGWAKCVNLCKISGLIWLVAICSAGCIAEVEIKRYLIKKAAELAFATATLAAQAIFEEFVENYLADLAIAVAEACFSCECPDGRCCPACADMKECCDGQCFDDRCCGECSSEQKCCVDPSAVEEVECIGIDECRTHCPECQNSQKCCDEKCIEQNKCDQDKCPECPLGKKCCDTDCIFMDECCPRCETNERCCGGVKCIDRHKCDKDCPFCLTIGDKCCEATGDCIPHQECSEQCPECPPLQFCCGEVCIDNDKCCPQCLEDQKCCKGDPDECLEPDDCCPKCDESEQCCNEYCIPQMDCCPQCNPDEVCCKGDSGADCCSFEEICCNGICESAGPDRYLRHLQGSSCCSDPTDVCCNNPQDPCCVDPTSACCINELDPNDPCCLNPNDPCCHCDLQLSICCNGECIPGDECCCLPSEGCCTVGSENFCVPEYGCCPPCTDDQTCCDGWCIGPDECCGDCSDGYCCTTYDLYFHREESFCVPDDQCCPPCFDDQTCCDGWCSSPDECCGGCSEGYYCCEGQCVTGSCCPSCEVGEKCCDGLCVNIDECPSDCLPEADGCVPLPPAHHLRR